MLELIGFIAIVYFAIKFFPDILLFAFKTLIVLIGLYLLVAALLAFFGPIIVVGAV
jgi:hypothetical protein